MQLSEMSSYMISKGLAQLPKAMMWMNGQLEAVSDDVFAIEQELHYHMAFEMQSIQVRP